MDLALLLSQTLSGDTNAIWAAQQQLAALAEQNWATLLQGYAAELANENQKPDVRAAAGLQIKTNLTSKSEERQEQINLKWQSLDPSVKNTIRLMALQSLASPVATVGRQAAQAVAAIATIDLPNNEWRDVITQLLQNINNVATTNNLNLVKSSLDALGYICDGIYNAHPDRPEILSGQANNILAAVAAGITMEQPDVKLKALTALTNSLQFVENNFKQEAHVRRHQNDRNYLMQVVCQATLPTNSMEVKRAALQCLVRIMSLYYSLMPLYMEKALFGITVRAMDDESDEVRLQAIEFWSTVCDVEREILDEDPSQCLSFAKGAMGAVVPKLLQLLYKEDPDPDDDDEWNVPKAAATCLLLMAQVVQGDIISYVLPWVTQNLNSSDWKQQEAATMAFGSILNGPPEHALLNHAASFVPILISMVAGGVPAVQDTAAWVLGCIAEVLPMALNELLQQVINSALAGLANQRTSVATSAAWTILNVADYFAASQTGSYAPTNPLSQYYPALVTALVRAAERPDANKHNLRIGALNALTLLVENSADDCLVIINQLLEHYMGALEAQIQNELGGRLLSSDDKTAHVDLIDNVCGILTAAIRRLATSIANQADRIMTIFLTLPTGPVSSKSASVIEGVIMGMGAVAGALEGQFEKYSAAVQPFLTTCLQMYNEPTVNTQAVGLLGDVARALHEAFVPQAEFYMRHLLQMASSDQVQQEVKPHILECFGDIALSIERHFLPFVPLVMPIFIAAGSLPIDTSDQYMVDLGIALRTAVVEGYAAIVQGCAGDPALVQYIPPMYELLVVVCRSHDTEASLLKGALGLLGDLTKAYPAAFANTDMGALELWAREHKHHSEAGVADSAQWAIEGLNSLRQYKR